MERGPVTLWIGGWVGLRAGPGAVEKRNISCTWWKSNSDPVFSLSHVAVLTKLWYLLHTSFALLNVSFLQIQANQWIHQMENANGLQTMKMTDSNFMYVLESGIRTGTPVLLEDVGETLDSALGPVLMKQTFFQVH
jgi:hypothetical protein